MDPVMGILTTNIQVTANTAMTGNVADSPLANHSTHIMRFGIAVTVV